jgi:hypothetical protein
MELGGITSLRIGALVLRSSDFTQAGAMLISSTGTLYGGAAGGSTDYNTLTNLPILGSASSQDVGYFATAAQGVDARTPTAHASNHQDGGSDPIAVGHLSIPTASYVIGAGYSLTVADEYEVTSALEIEVASSGVLEVLG